MPVSLRLQTSVQAFSHNLLNRCCPARTVLVTHSKPSSEFLQLSLQNQKTKVKRIHQLIEEFMKNIKYQGNHTKTRLQKIKQQIKKMSFKLHLSLNSISAVELKKT